MFFGLALNCGKGFPIERDADAVAFVESMRGQPVFVGMQAEGREWLRMFSRETRARFEFDRELVRNIDSSYIRREMTRALKAFADRIGSTIIAEGIERGGELESLLDLGIEYGQGYLLGRPAAAFLPRTAPTPPSLAKAAGSPARRTIAPVSPRTSDMLLGWMRALIPRREPTPARERTPWRPGPP